MEKILKIGITGHQRLDDESSWLKVRSHMMSILSRQQRPIVGLTSLAIGADQLFAQVFLELGESYEVIIPFDGYDQKFGHADRLRYRELLAAASRSVTLPGGVSEEEAYFMAGKQIVQQADLMIAVWDGEPAAGLGGTADVVSFARNNNKLLELIDPNHL